MEEAHPIETLDFYRPTRRYNLQDRATCLLPEISSSTLKMEAICSSETSDDTQRTTRRYIPEADTFHSHRCENLKSNIRKDYADVRAKQRTPVRSTPHIIYVSELNCHLQVIFLLPGTKFVHFCLHIIGSFCSSNITEMNKSRRMWWAGNIARTGLKTNTYKTF
jgi:hypothetical protein